MKPTFWSDYKICVSGVVRPPFTQDTVVEFFVAILGILFIVFAVAVNLITLTTFPLTALICTFIVRWLRTRQEKRKQLESSADGR